MKLEAIERGERLDIPYFEGVNCAVGHVLAKKTELAHAENARSKVIGTIEKREGQTITGLNQEGGVFVTSGNYGLAFFGGNGMDTLYRISQESRSIEIDVSDRISLIENIDFTPSAVPLLTISTGDDISLGESIMDNPSVNATIYYLNKNTRRWTALTGKGTGFLASNFSKAVSNQKLYLVNGYSRNRHINSDGITVSDSSTTSGDFYNSPDAKKVAFYKNRIYLANFKKDFTWYPTHVLRSSYPLGIIALVNEDTSTTSGDVKITDNKYFYSDSGMNIYDIYRGPVKIAKLTVSIVSESSVTATVNYEAGQTSLLSADEIWVSGTYAGAKKYRWISNPTSSGKDVKLYDTFSLSGGDGGEIKMLETIGDVLMAGNNSSLSTWNDYSLQTFDVGVGCVSFDGYVKSFGSLYFVHYTGIYTTSGGLPTLVSQKVQRYIDGATKEGLENSACGKKGRSVFFKIGTVTLYAQDGSVDKILYNTALEYAISENNWYVHTNVVGNQFETHRDSEELDRLEMIEGSGINSVKEFLAREVADDCGVEIPFRIDTHDVPLQKAFENLSNPYSLIVESDRGASMRAFARLDREQFYGLDGEIMKGVSTVKIHNRDSKRGQPPPTRLFGLSIRDVSKQICKINRLSILSIPTLADGDHKQ